MSTSPLLSLERDYVTALNMLSRVTEDLEDRFSDTGVAKQKIK